MEEKEERRRLASDYTRGTVSRERVMTRGAKLFRNAVNALFSAPWYFQIEFPFVGQALR